MTYKELKVYRLSEFPAVWEYHVYHLLLNGDVVYVGMSKELLIRIGYHARDPKKHFDSFRFYPVGSQDEAAQRESEDIWKFNPKLNQCGAKHPDYRKSSVFPYGGTNRGELAAYLKKQKHIEKCGEKFYHIDVLRDWVEREFPKLIAKKLR